MAVDPAFATCAVCDAPSSPERPLLRCSGCFATCYCSPEHQREHWKRGHNKRCKELCSAERTNLTKSLSSAGRHAPKAAAAFTMAMRIMEGELPGGPAAAVPHLRAAVDLGFAAAATNLAGLLCQGAPGVPADEREAVRLFRLAADAGDTIAMYNLGRYLVRGAPRTERNAVEGVRLLRGAAEAGDEDACLLLAQCYELGEGGPRDLAEADRWRRKAGRRGRPGDSAEDLLSGAVGFAQRAMADSKAVGVAMKLVERGKDGGGAEGGVPRGTVVRGCFKGGAADGVVASGVVAGLRQIVRAVGVGATEVVAMTIDAIARDAGVPVPGGFAPPDTAPAEKAVEFLSAMLGAKIIPIGTRVTLEGLRTERLNGQAGVIVASPGGGATSGKDLTTRQAVRLDATGEVVSVKPTNLRR